MTTSMKFYFSVIFLSLFLVCEAKKKANTQPNIILILADDLGYGDLSYLGQKTLKTPNIDKLAEEGMIFTNHYSGSAVCGPSRGVLMSGQHTGHAAIRGNKFFPSTGVATLDPNIPTLPETIKTGTNYTTAMCGRWHCGGELSNQTPYDRGFDYHFGKLSSNYRNRAGQMIDQYWDKEGKHIPYEKYSKLGIEPIYENGKRYNLSATDMTMRPINMDELVTEKAIHFIKEKRNQPYFLYVAYHLVHDPIEYHKKHPILKNDWPKKELAFATMLKALDSYIGQLVTAVDKAGETGNTIIIFTSDNGAHNEGGHNVNFFNSNGVFKEYKRSFYEGGFHTPLIIKWPGVIDPGSHTELLSAFWDMMPTFCDMAGAPIPKHTDGISFLPTLLDEKQKKHEYLYWEFNENIHMEKEEYKQAVRMENWKGIYYIDKDKFELYDLSKDISEKHDLSKDYPEIVSKITKIMNEAHIPSEHFPLLISERNKERL